MTLELGQICSWCQDWQHFGSAHHGTSCYPLLKQLPSRAKFGILFLPTDIILRVQFEARYQVTLIWFMCSVHTLKRSVLKYDVREWLVWVQGGSHTSGGLGGLNLDSGLHHSYLGDSHGSWLEKSQVSQPQSLGTAMLSSLNQPVVSQTSEHLPSVSPIAPDLNTSSAAFHAALGQPLSHRAVRPSDLGPNGQMDAACSSQFLFVWCVTLLLMLYFHALVLLKRQAFHSESLSHALLWHKRVSFPFYFWPHNWLARLVNWKGVFPFLSITCMRSQVFLWLTYLPTSTYLQSHPVVLLRISSKDCHTFCSDIVS